jgi:hypothetical protein
MSTLTATAMDKEWTACNRYPAKRHRSERATRELIRGFSKWHASVRLIAVAFAGAATFGTHAPLCYQFCPVAVALLVVCLLLSSGTKQTNTQSQSKRYCFLFRYPDHGELFYLRTNMIEEACREPRTLLTTPFYVKRLRLIHDVPDTDEDSNAESAWRFDDPKFLQECHYVWEVFGVEEPPSTEPDKDGFRFVDFTCKRA